MKLKMCKILPQCRSKTLRDLKNKEKKPIKFFAALCFFLSIGLSGFSEEIKRGILDLRNADFRSSPVLTLSGEIGFYNNKLVFSKEDIEKAEVFIQCPYGLEQSCSFRRNKAFKFRKRNLYI